MVWELDHLLDYHDDGRLTRNQYVTELKDLVARHPGFIDGHAHLAFALLEQDKPKLALGAGLCGLALGEEAIPPDFEGKVEWSFLGVCRIGRTEEAKECWSGLRSDYRLHESMLSQIV